MSSPPPISDAVRTRFARLLTAFRENKIAVVSATRKADNLPVLLICSTETIETPGEEYNNVEVTPLAVMIDGDPDSQFYDPSDVDITINTAPKERLRRIQL